MKYGNFIFSILISLALMGCSESTSNKNSGHKTIEFEEIGYFKDGSKNRIYTIKYSSNALPHHVRAHAEKLMYTDGQMMAAYYYKEGSTIPADGVTLAASMIKASDVIYEAPGLSKWQFAFMKSFNGVVVFVDCIKDQNNDLCRKS
jgi:hypothetical protein